MQKLRIVVGGYIGLFPTGGVTWDYIQYPLGLQLLGHDVFYIEDTGQYSFYKSPGRSWDDPTDTVEFLHNIMKRFGLDSRWAYRDVGTGNCFGLSYDKVLDVCKTADVFINISASTQLREEYLNIPKRILIDSDPMFTQVQEWDDADAEHSLNKIQKGFNSYTDLFTFGENIAKEDCRIPTYDLNWHSTRQPICLEYWRKNEQKNPCGTFTTVMNWSTRKKMKYNNEEWGQKDVEFEKFVDIPSIFKKSPFTIIAADSSKRMDHSKLKNFGWEILDPLHTINDIYQYQAFIDDSLGEFSVAKETYVKSKSGWFSCRSACYLAAGKPVVTQETGWSKYIPSGRGLFAFHDHESAICALEEVYSNTQKHCREAEQIAFEFFDSNKVLKQMLSKIS